MEIAKVQNSYTFYKMLIVQVTGACKKWVQDLNCTKTFVTFCLLKVKIDYLPLKAWIWKNYLEKSWKFFRTYWKECWKERRSIANERERVCVIFFKRWVQAHPRCVHSADRNMATYNCSLAMSCLPSQDL